MDDSEKQRRLRRLRNELSRALQEVDELLGASIKRPRPRQRRSQLALVTEILRRHPGGLDIHTLVKKMEEAGYMFTGDGVAPTRTLLYTRPEFVRHQGLFRLAKRRSS